jgi:ribosomal protein S18 acetylase RimI-like enzyme
VMMIDIRIMSEKDIDFAVSMTDMESWGYLGSDFKRLISLEPKGCFVAWQENTPVGIVTTSSYDNYGFIGTLIVDRPYRDAKIGEALMINSIDYLGKKGVTTIELDGVFEAVSLYRRLGFKDKYFSYRLNKIVEDGEGEPQNFEPSMLDELIAFDREMTGLARERHLIRFAEDFANSIYVIKTDALRTYAVVRPHAEKRITVGPMIADSPESGEKLLLSILNKFNGYRLGLGVPEPNRQFIELLRRLKFQHTVPSLRMYLGRRLNYEEHICCIISPEKG